MSNNNIVNAIDKAYLVMQGFRELEKQCNEEKHPDYADQDHPINYVFSNIKGGDWPSCAVDECSFTTRVGVKPGVKLEAARQQAVDFLTEYLKDDPFFQEYPPEFSMYGLAAEGVVVDVREEMVQKLFSAHNFVSGKEPTYLYVTCPMDSRFWPLYYGKPAVAYGPTGANFHGHDEYVNLSSVLEVTKVIAKFIMDWCGLAR
jgi:acetylornithine deacetylase